MIALLFILAVIQGVIEWIPVSSEGQSMIYLVSLIGLDPSQAFSLTIWLHIGTALAALLVYRKDFRSVLSFDNADISTSKIRNFLIVGTLFTALTAVPLYLVVKEFFSLFYGDLLMFIVSLLLVLTGVLIIVSKRNFGYKIIDNLTVRDMILVGVIQGLAVLPGLSRSGLTIAALLLLKYTQKETLKLSFMLSVPAVLAGVVFDYLNYGAPLTVDISLIILISMILIAFIVGALTVKLLIRLSEKINFGYFALIIGLIGVGASLLPMLSGDGAALINSFITASYDFAINLILLIGPIGFFLAMVIQAIAAPIPSELVLMFGGGAFYTLEGFIGSLLLTGIVGGLGECAGALCSFYISRFGGRPIATKLVGEENIKFADEWFKRWGGWAVLIGRLTPLIPFDAVSYGAGLTKMSLKVFMLATIIGAFPRAFFYGYVGILIQQAIEVGGIEFIYTLVSCVIVAVIILVLVVHRMVIKKYSTNTVAEE
ncbi:MAG: undecaprenyl-diphosphate phosphatase [Candidatus Odinarchaeia archaeon]